MVFSDMWRIKFHVCKLPPSMQNVCQGPVPWQHIVCKLIPRWLDISLYDAPMSQVINDESSHEAWKVLETLYGSHTRNGVQQMKSEHQSLTKWTSLLKDYLHKAKSLALSLRGAGKPMDDDDFIICILRGLGLEFDLIVVAINVQDIFSYFEKDIIKLQNFKMYHYWVKTLICLFFLHHLW